VWVVVGLLLSLQAEVSVTAVQFGLWCAAVSVSCGLMSSVPSLVGVLVDLIVSWP